MVNVPRGRFAKGAATSLAAAGEFYSHSRGPGRGFVRFSGRLPFHEDMNLFETRNLVPQSLPGDLGPLVELRTTDPELQLIVPAMHFAEHAHMKL